MAIAADIALSWNGTTFTGDVSLAAGDLVRGNDLATAVVASLFSWRRAAPDDKLPDYVTSKMGWWGDTFLPNAGDKFGSKLWELRREKLTADTINRAVEYAREALQWLIDDRVAQRIEVSAERQGNDRLDMVVTVYQARDGVQSLRFSGVWQAIQQGA